MLLNNLWKLSGKPITEEWLECKDQFESKFIFIGEYDPINNKPDGIGRMIYEYGDIGEGSVTLNGLMNGWNILYYDDIVEMGWYKNNELHGNAFRLNDDLTVDEEGWY